MNFDLQRALVVANHFRTNNLFFFPAESSLWLSCVESTTALLNRLMSALSAANGDIDAVYALIRARSDRMEALVTSDLVTIARLKAGAAHGLTYAQAYDTEMALWEVYAAQAREAGLPEPARPTMPVPTEDRLQAGLTGEDAIKTYFEKRKIIEESEAKNCIRDASIMLLPYKGVVRRARKLAHNIAVMDRIIDERLYVASDRVAAYVRDLVVRGLLGPQEQGIFRRIVSAFITSRPWSATAQNRLREWEKIWNDARNVRDERGAVYLRVVEDSLRYTGVAV